MADHLIIAPVVLPLVAGAVMLLLGERRREFKAAINVASTLCARRHRDRAARHVRCGPAGDRAAVYRLGDWPAPFGIVLVVDRLSALMLLLTSILASRRRGLLPRALAPRGRAFPFAVPVPADGRQRRVPDGRSLQPVRLLRAAARRLVRPGAARLGRGARQGRAALHRGQPGRIAAVPDRRQPDLWRFRNAQHGGSRRAHPGHRRGEPGACWRPAPAILGVAFLLKAGMWPLCFWLPTTYAAASPPVASIFAIMTKVGVYIVLRLWLLLFGEGAGASAGFGGEWLLFGGMATVAFGAIGTLGVAGHGPARRLFGARVLRNGARRDRHGAGRRHRRSALLPGQLDARHQRVLPPGRARRARPRAGRGRARRHPGGIWGGRRRLDEEDEVGIAIPATMGVLGLAFIGCALVDRRAAAAVRVYRQVRAPDRRAQPVRDRPGRRAVPAASWALLVVLILSGLAALIAMTRAGIRAFWAAPDRAVPRVRMIEMAPVAVLLHPLRGADGPGRAGHALHAGHGPLAARAARLRARRAAAGRTTSRARRAGHDAAPALPAGQRPGCSRCGCCSIRRFRRATSSSAACSRSPAAGH